ncbi:unnamed protein product (macronuclear) [Paramecium tetraurelia]|uniref:EGF-like domain-containing protein n=1 Tax=Paramecium tetraurelia TaxID=5888 RepID=A0CW24_PARTE|nr:uncharacterized protein GSPATT00001193001 [Paramecium tetraurelia]CAK74991.1 unnamed protein product [Paramecium tetraurelia]|eukprot:XP_001442388.1 hypothetical protein (macronuclear) [Paramecium tetraurelia strain d4-2]
MLFTIFIILKVSLCDWRLIYSNFYSESISTANDWDFKQNCSVNQIQGSSIKQCGTNPLDFLRLKDDRTKLEKQFYYPHYQIRLLTDVIYFRSLPGTNSQFNIFLVDSFSSSSIFQRQYQQNDLQKYENVCQYTCGGGGGGGGCSNVDDKRVEIKTVALDSINHHTPTFNISYCYMYQDSDMRIGLRNILLYVKPCHFSCLSCSGSTSLDCLTCYQGTLQGGLCLCDEANSYVSLLTGCTQECNRDYYLADTSKYCQFDPRIKSKVSYFTSNSLSNGNLLPQDPWTFIPDPFYPRNQQMLLSCGGTDLIGKFYNYEGIQIQLAQNKALKFIRIRASFYFNGWQPDSQLIITADSYSRATILKTATNYTYTQSSLSYFSSLSCSGLNYDLVRIETVLKTYTYNPVIKFQAITGLTSETWAFRNVTIDYGLCQSNCTSCETYSRCLICDSGYQLYRGTCVSSCPIYSILLTNGTCQDYEDLIENSRYLVKAFYDMNTTLENLGDIVDNFTDLSNAIQTSFTGQLYSFVPQKSVLGGVLVWKSGKFKKSFYSLRPHYQVSYRLNFTFGDENTGWFKYKFHSFQSASITNPNTGAYNSVGGNKKETTKYYEIIQQSHTGSQLDIELSADTNQANLQDAFMYVSEYFVVVHYCAPFCSGLCHGPLIGDCDSVYTGFNTTNYCASNEYLNFDTSTQVYSCLTCSLLGCNECQSSTVCTRCEFTSTNQFYLAQGQCQCYPSAFLSGTQCIQCDSYCESCFGSNSNECYSCVTDFHRSIFEFECNCIDGYYDDGYNLQCLPICGDQLVVDGEDCDDGNDNPFDGCNQCQLSCQEECSYCQRGKCYECKDNYILIEPIYYCINNCGDQIIVGIEACDDGNIYPNDGCYECQFQCYEHCTNCYFGICLECDQENGWYLTGSNCESVCGDNIIVYGQEECDDGNFNPFDLCDSCVLSCAEFCDLCTDGKCQKCKSGFQYIAKTQQCIPICGDFKVVGYENCDDNNFVLFDGCYQCQFKCQDSCTNCLNGQCYECNTQGWILNLSTLTCESVLDDNIISDEQCDDGNITPMDGCFQQQYECQDSCIQCYLGYCLACQSNWQLDMLSHLCFPICGDGMTVGDEVCEDSNSSIYDGCYQCQIQCDQNCQICDFSVCQVCQLGFALVNNRCIEVCGDGIVVEQEECDDQINDLDQICNQCKYTCNVGCKVCVSGSCELCEDGYLLQDFQCQSICGDRIISGSEQCDDGNSDPFDGCDQCQLLCQQECLDCQFGKCYDCQVEYLVDNYQCVDLCGNEEISKNEQCDDGNLEPYDGCYNCLFSCDQNCQVCQSGYCLQCKNVQWQINPIDFTCQPFCGDTFVVGSEQCDDGNDVRYDGCYECFFECQDSCISCVEGECQECDVGWDLINKLCTPLCGDLLIVGNEQCEDGNDIQYDGCYECQYQCQDECTLCNKGVCQACDTLGWTLIHNQCFPLCGDGIVISPIEQCDDGNQQQFDGCYDCNYQCQEICGECIDGKCYKCNELGWLVEKFICVPYCGDGLVVGNEQCDDGALVSNSCINCKLYCDSYCIDCNNGICNSCDVGRYLDNNLCLPLCGDGLYVHEGCDDGNLENGDGCSDTCMVEKDWVCINTIFMISTCFYSVSPQMKLELLTQNPENVEKVLITFNQPMVLKYNESFDANHYFQGNVSNLVFEQYLIEFNFTVQPEYQTAQAISVQATITFYENIEDPILIVILNQTAIVSEYQTIVVDNEKELKLKTPIVISQGLLESSQSAKSFTNTIIYFMVALSALCILTGSFEMFWNLMDLLQYLSYIKYVNIQFPANLNIYFEVFKLISIQPIMDATGISAIFGLLDGNEDQVVQTSEKFLADDINGYFYTNFQSSIFCLIGLYLGFFIAKFMTSLLYRIGPYHISLTGYYVGKVIYVLRNLLRQSKQEFYYNGILRMVMSNYYDISFSVFIQLVNFNTTSAILSINSYAALIVFCLQMAFFAYMLTKQISFSKEMTVSKKEQYSALFDGIAESQNIWVTQYNTILLLKKQIFIFLIVYMEYNGTLQAIIIAFSQTIFLIYVCKLKPLSNLYEYYKILVADSFLAFNTLLFLAYAYRIQLNLSIDDYLLIGWFHIASFSFILVFSLLCDLKNQAAQIYKKIVALLTIKVPVQNQGATVIFY